MKRIKSTIVSNDLMAPILFNWCKSTKLVLSLLSTEIVSELCTRAHALTNIHKLHFTSLDLSHSLVDRWGTKDDRATTVLHSSLFSAFRRASPNFNPVHSVTLSSYLFFCLPLLLPPCTVPCRIIFASPVGLVLCLYHLSFRFFTVVRRSS